MIIKRYIVEFTDSEILLGGLDEACERLKREWGAEEIEASEDCVKRIDVINGIANTHFTISSEDYKELIDVVNNLPSAVSQNKKGHWIPCHPLQADDPGAYKCSVCGYGDWGLDPKIDKFCFNCGADMREVQDAD